MILFAPSLRPLIGRGGAPRTPVKTLSILSVPLLSLGLAAFGAAQAPKPVLVRYSQDLSAFALPTPTFNDNDRRLFLGFQLFDGAQGANNSTRVTLSNFRLTGGTFGDVLLPTIGGVTIGNDGSVTLRDSDPIGLADYTVAFRVPSGAISPRLEFDFELAPSSFDTVNDYFAVSFLTGDERAITTDASGMPNRIGSESLGLGFDGNPATTPGLFTATPEFAASRLALGDPRFVTLARPTETVLVLPEPGTYAALGFGILALARRRRAKRA